ncbi:MBL fold metallo-hydrolase [Halorarius halobius]|uniref:MBL fold metallo-hydrolase n=1 Tax=Halorarius halobius TaxID=2962671 RepID=UPI0020CED66C|nr:MBL fold metallo-hydrolase [Halorarius halobius]
MSTFQVTDGVYGIDIGMFDAGVASVYLFDDEEPTLVDAGTAASAETIMDGLADCGVEPAALEHLVLSHIHVDHSGAASALVDAAPNLDVYIHESTAPHLVDPEGLIESSRRAMGDHFASMGEQGAVPEANVVGVGDDGTTVDIGANSLELLYAPGHSPDHFAVWNPERELLFAAECLGIYLARADRWLPPATLPNFDVEMIADAIDRLRALDPERIVFPHFGEWPGEPAAAFERAERELHRFDDRILELHDASESRAETKRAVAAELVDAAPPYSERVESFYASLITDGFLKHHGIE